MKFSLFTILISSFIVISPVRAEQQFSIGMTSYGGNLHYFAAGPTWMAPCSNARSTAREYLEAQCRSNGYTGPVNITRDQVIDSGHLGWTGSDLVQRQAGHEMYCEVEATVICTQDLVSPICYLSPNGKKWNLFKRESLYKAPLLIKKYSGFKDYIEARDESIKNQAAYGRKFVDKK